MINDVNFKGDLRTITVKGVDKGGRSANRMPQELQGQALTIKSDEDKEEARPYSATERKISVEPLYRVFQMGMGCGQLEVRGRDGRLPYRGSVLL